MLERKIEQAPKMDQAPSGYPKQVVKQTYLLRLYVNGTTPVSAHVIARMRITCEEVLNGRFELEVIDIRERPMLKQGEHVMPAPTMVKLLPIPLRRPIAVLASAEGKLFGLDVVPRREIVRR